MEQYFYLKEHFVMDYMVHHPKFMARSVQGKGRSVYVETGGVHRQQNGLATSTSQSVANVIVKHDGLEGTVIQNNH